MPRSEQENQCVLDTSAEVSEECWLGLNDVRVEGLFVGTDGCGVVWFAAHAWDAEQPNNLRGDQDRVTVLPSGGWNDREDSYPCYPICQLELCYQPGCQ